MLEPFAINCEKRLEELLGRLMADITDIYEEDTETIQWAITVIHAYDNLIKQQNDPRRI